MKRTYNQACIFEKFNSQGMFQAMSSAFPSYQAQHLAAELRDTVVTAFHLKILSWYNIICNCFCTHSISFNGANS